MVYREGSIFVKKVGVGSLKASEVNESTKSQLKEKVEKVMRKR